MRQTAARQPRPGVNDAERAVLVHLSGLADADAAHTDELRLLVTSAGAEVCELVVGRRPHPDAATYIGRGKAAEVQDAVERLGADLVVINHPISPVQERNLQRICGCRVVDRTRLILDIFAQRASSHEGKLQVELAQLEHLSTRLVRGWTHLERQKGGIGLRGPGETQLETDRRLLGRRIKTLRDRLGRVRGQRSLRRRARHRVPVPTVSLVGYTNAGKSSLFNRLTSAQVYEADKLFATLDPTMRRLDVDGIGAVVLSDTVGFIRDLPHSLVEAFHSTLEEVSSASLLVHVVDAADAEHRAAMGQVESVLEEIDAADVPRITVFNKIDAAGDTPRLERNASGLPHRVWVSARTGAGLDLLQAALAEWLGRNQRCYRLALPPRAGRLRARLYERARVLAEEVDVNGTFLLDVQLDDADLGWLSRQAEFQDTYLVPEADVHAAAGAGGG